MAIVNHGNNERKECETANVTMTNNSNGTIASVSSDPSSSPFFIWSSFTMAGIGLIANGFVLLILMHKKLRRRLANILITIQVGSDFLTCFLIIGCNAYSLGIGNRPLSDDTVGYFVCMFIVGYGIVTMSMNSTVGNLCIIAIERYLEICHSLKHRKYFRR